MKKPDYKSLQKILWKMVEKDYGRCCLDFSLSCVICRKYIMLAELGDCEESKEYEKKNTIGF